jgi:hypothetical protein
LKLPSRKLTAIDAAIVKALLAEGWLQSDIASLLGCNSGRVAEIATRQTFPDVEPAILSDLGPRARIAEIQVAWTLRIGRQLSEALRPKGTIL